jgi:hypothetical protein
MTGGREQEVPEPRSGEAAPAGWTTPRQLQEQLNRLWDRGELLRGLAGGDALVPLRLTLKGPGSAELAVHFEAVRTWIARLNALPYVRIEWREFRHRVLGAQRVPQSVWVDTLDAAFAMIGRTQEAHQFGDLAAMTHSRRPALSAWVAKRPLVALKLANEWERLLAVVDWLSEHPRPGIYPRQVDIEGVHSKFMEDHRAVLTEMLDIALPTDSADPAQSGISHFAARYGFLDKPVRIRFRVLDSRIELPPGLSCADITLDADSFSRLTAPIRRAFITENETNFLAFPPVAHSIVIFGSGYGWDALAKAQWLSQCALLYWGDIDTHGFAILDSLREHFGHVESLLMDKGTLLAHEKLWGSETNQVTRDLPRLTAPEQAVFNDLRDNRIRDNLRLEQEHLGFNWVQRALNLEIGEVE